MLATTAKVSAEEKRQWLVMVALEGCGKQSRILREEVYGAKIDGGEKGAMML